MFLWVYTQILTLIFLLFSEVVHIFVRHCRWCALENPSSLFDLGENTWSWISSCIWSFITWSCIRYCRKLTFLFLGTACKLSEQKPRTTETKHASMISTAADVVRFHLKLLQVAWQALIINNHNHNLHSNRYRAIVGDLACRMFLNGSVEHNSDTCGLTTESQEFHWKVDVIPRNKVKPESSKFGTYIEETQTYKIFTEQLKRSDWLETNLWSTGLFYFLGYAFVEESVRCKRCRNIDGEQKYS